MNDLFTWKSAQKRPSRKYKKRMARKEKRCRQIMVHYAGNHLLISDSDDGVRATTAQAQSWTTLRPVRVPRRLRRFIGDAVGGPSTFPRAYTVSFDMQAVITAYSKAGEPVVAVSEGP